jgi:DNA polymerase III epsilon subunit-like protein
VDPGRPISPEAYRVNRISSELLRGAPPFSQIVDQVLEHLEGAAIVAHNAPFDLSFLVAALEEIRYPIPDNPVVDTLALARTCYGFPRNNLQAIAHDLEIFIPEQHRAMGDAWTTRRVLEFFSQDLQARWGIGTLGELIHAQGGPIHWPQPHPHEYLPDALAQALEENLLLHLRYQSSQGQISQRTVEPLRIGLYRGTTYLVARCMTRNEQRTFRLDRILEMRIDSLA